LILRMVDSLNIFSSDCTACSCTFIKLSSCDGWGSGPISGTRRLDDALLSLVILERASHTVLLSK
jgi:hypothetical protein